MSIERRMKLLEALEADQPGLQQIVSGRDSLLEGNWDLTAYSFQQGFEALWDHAVARVPGASGPPSPGLIAGPLMLLWRQSVELSIKAAIEGTTRCEPPGVHSLTELFDTLLKARRDHGGLEADDDDHTAKVIATIAEFQALDERADRWRYPTNRKGQPYRGFSVDLDRLYQAHAIITGWCDFVSSEAEHLHIHGGG